MRFTIFFGFIGVVNRAYLQAKLSFKYLAFIGLSGSSIKLVTGVILVLIGFKAIGVMFAFFLAMIIPYFLTFMSLKFIFKMKSDNVKIDFYKLLGYGSPAAITLLGLTLFINMDILLVKHFFDPKSAGIYATLSLIGRIIYFLTSSINTAMFPLIVQKHTKNENFHNIFRLSLLLVFLPSLFMTIFYFVFPEYVIQLFTRKDQYSFVMPRIAPFLGYFGIFITEYSVLSILANFFLSIKKTKVFIPIAIGAAMQAILLWFNHSTYFQIIIISLISTGLPLLALLLYYFKCYGWKVQK